MGQEAIRGPEPGRQTLWDWRAAGNFSFGGTGTSLFVFAALAGLRNPDWLRLAGLPALVLVGAGLGCVALEIGRPFRSLNVFFRVRSSWMSREAWAAAALFVLGAPAAVFELAWLAVAAAVLSLAMLYTQARMLQAAKGIPAWRVPAVVPLMLVTGLCEGMAALGVGAAVLERRAAAVAGGLAVLLALRLWTWRNYRRALGEAGAPRAAIAALDATQRSFVIRNPAQFRHCRPSACLAAACDLAARAGSGAGAGAAHCLPCGALGRLVPEVRPGHARRLRPGVCAAADARAHPALESRRERQARLVTPGRFSPAAGAANLATIGAPKPNGGKRPGAQRALVTVHRICWRPRPCLRFTAL
ncbi:MAG: dimethyl sulfoxide reductase anchor subunit [Deltaproteobacteria bacterium]|nr:dimethyl sulfoxide reductase anchor subunit [Deltaproteobacteria bacterium]